MKHGIFLFLGRALGETGAPEAETRLAEAVEALEVLEAPQELARALRAQASHLDPLDPERAAALRRRADELGEVVGGT